MTQDTAVSTLNNLIETCRDGEQGFRNAAENLRDPEVKSLFSDFARERAGFAQELEQEVRRLGGTPSQSGTVSGAVHRGWMDVKGAVAGRDDASIIAEAERGEDTAVAAYEDALRHPLPSGLDSVVHRQHTRIKEVHDRVHALEESRR